MTLLVDPVELPARLPLLEPLRAPRLDGENLSHGRRLDALHLEPLPLGEDLLRLALLPDLEPREKHRRLARFVVEERRVLGQGHESRSMSVDARGDISAAAAKQTVTHHPSVPRCASSRACARRRRRPMRR